MFGECDKARLGQHISEFRRFWHMAYVGWTQDTELHSVIRLSTVLDVVMCSPLVSSIFSLLFSHFVFRKKTNKQILDMCELCLKC